MLQKISNSSNIYSDGTYLRNNPSLHSEDSAYKFSYIHQLLKQCNFPGPELRVLDIGGGGGLIAAFVCEYLTKQGFRVECHSFDLSAEMLLQQQSNNPFNSFATSDFTLISTQTYDLALLIDVIEHIPNNGPVADDVDRIARQIIYNIPVECNLFDWLRDLYMKRSFYALQTESLGHLHFFSYREAKRFVRAHHLLVDWIFPDYPRHILESDYSGYAVQRSNWLRGLELRVSCLIYKFLRPLAPWLIQGSLFILAKSRSIRH